MSASYSIPSPVSELSDFLPPSIQNYCGNIVRHFENEKLSIGVLATEKRFLVQWEAASAQFPRAEVQYFSASQPERPEDVFNLRFADLLFVSSSILQLITDDLYKTIEALKNWKKPLFVFIHNLELVGFDPAVIQEKMQEAAVVFPYRPDAVLCAKNPKSQVDTALASTLESHFSALFQQFSGEISNLRLEQKKHFDAELKTMTADKLLPRQHKFRRQQQKFHYELQTASREADIQKKHGTPLSNFARSWFDKIIVSIMNFDVADVLNTFEKEIFGTPFDYSTYMYKLREKTMQCFAKKQESILVDPFEFDHQSALFLNNLAAYWAQGLDAWTSIEGADTSLFKQWIDPEQIRPYFLPFFEQFNQILTPVSGIYSEAVEKSVTMAFYQYRKDLKNKIKETYTTNNSLFDLIKEEPKDIRYWDKESFKKEVNLIDIPTLPQILNAICYAACNEISTIIGAERRTRIAKCDAIQEVAMVSYNQQLLQALRQDYARFEAHYKTLLEIDLS